MHFMHCLRNATPLSMLPCLSSTSSTSAPPRTRLCVSTGHAYPSLARNYMCRSLGHLFRPVNSAVDKPSTSSINNENHDKIARCRAGASLVLACVIGAFSASLLRSNPVAIAIPIREMYQKAPKAEEFPSVGKTSLESLLEVTSLMVSDDLDGSSIDSYGLPPRPSLVEVKNIKKYAVWLIKCGRAEDALQYLNEAYSIYKGDPEPAYNVEMALVEILICLGKYEEASIRDCITGGNKFRLSDARLPLYKAIIYTMLENREEAVIWWSEYTKAIEEGLGPVW